MIFPNQHFCCLRYIHSFLPLCSFFLILFPFVVQSYLVISPKNTIPFYNRMLDVLLLIAEMFASSTLNHHTP